MRGRVEDLVPGGPSALSEEVAGHGEAQAQLRQYLTQLAGDVVGLQRSLQVRRGGCT